LRRATTLGAASAVALLLSTALQPVQGGGLPSGGVTVGGSATIGTPSANAVTVQQNSNRAIVNWSGFSVGQGNSVTFAQPSSSAAILNRVTGNAPTSIAGAVSANGSVYVVNQNGVQITPTGTVDTRGGFVASTLDIANSDFMAGRNNFQGNGGAVVNQGKITTGPGGTVALLGSTVSNDGLIEAPLGKVGLGSGASATLDVNGDGFMQVILPAATTDADGKPLVSNNGKITAPGGTVALRAATVAGAIRNAVNVPGSIQAQSVSGHDGAIVLDGGAGGAVQVGGSLDASVAPPPARAVRRAAGKPATSGGTVSVTTGGPVTITGQIAANGGQTGGRIDVTGSSVTLSGAMLSATGTDQGGLVRVGGPFQGGRTQDPASPLAALYVDRFGTLPDLAIAGTTTVDAASRIDVSASGAKGSGGTAIVWSSDATVMAGNIIATGQSTGGAVEISSASTIQTIALANIALGPGGTLLLDPANINIDDTSPGDVSGSSLQNVAFATNTGTTTHIYDQDLLALLNVGTNVVLQASNDVTWYENTTLGSGAFFFVNPTSGHQAGNLTIQAGESISMRNGSFGSGGGTWTLIGNDTVADGVVDSDRGGNAAVVDLSGSVFQMNAGSLTVKLLEGPTTNNLACCIELSTPTVGGVTGITGNALTAYISPNATQVSATLPTRIMLFGDVSVSDGLTLTGNVQLSTSSSSVTLSSGNFNWTDEGTALLYGGGGKIFEVLQNGTLIRYGRLVHSSIPPTAPVDLSLGVAGDSFTRYYGDADPTGDQLNQPQLTVTSGTAGDALTAILAAGSLSVSGPGATAAATTSGILTVTPSANFAINSGLNSNYYINTSAYTIPLTINKRPITPIISNGSYTYGSPSAVISLSNIVNGDAITPVVTLDSTSGLLMTANGGGFGFAATTAAGGHNFTLTGISGSQMSNYTLDLSGTVTGTLAIAQKQLTYTFGTATTPYGTIGSFTSSLSGIVGTDDVQPVFGFTSTGGGSTLALATDIPVGTYRVTATGLSGGAASNYSIALTGNTTGTYTVNPATITYSLGIDVGTYGTLATPMVTLNGVLSGDSVAGTIALLQSGNPVTFSATTAAGTYTETVGGLTGTSASNYQLASSGNTAGLLIISPKTLTYTGGGGTITYGSVMPGATLNGVVGSDQVSGTQQIAINSGGISTSSNYSVGSYTTTLNALTGADASNYVLATTGNTPGSVTIVPKLLTYSYGTVTGTYSQLVNIPAATLSGVVTGDLVSPLFSLSSGGAILSDQPAGSYVIRDPHFISVVVPEPVGNYALTATSLSGLDAGNYTIAGSGNTPGTLTLQPLPITWSVANTQATYGNTPTYSVTLNGVPTVNVAGAPQVDPVGNVTATSLGGTVTTLTGIGTYTASVTSLSGPGASNFSLASSGNSPGTLTITPRPVSYGVANASSIYGTLATPGAVTINGLVNGDSIGGTLAILSGGNPVTLTARSAAGSYSETVTGLTGGAAGNYTLLTNSTSDTPGTLTIAPLALTFTTTSASSTYGTAASLATGTLSGILAGDTVTAGPTIVQGDGVPGAQQAAGTYSLVVGICSARRRATIRPRWSAPRSAR
jgi:filamentous hemagglutinin family protein